MKRLIITSVASALLSLNTFAQQSCGTVTDFDGNTYKTVQLGNQCWMAENLRTKHYANGTSISHGNIDSKTTAYWYYPDGNSDNAQKYGLLYNWPAVMYGATSSNSNPSGRQGICPRGWHVPSNAEWTQLENYVGSQSKYQCNDNSENIAKALASTLGWKSDTSPCAVGNDPSGNNASGFSAVPAGFYGSIPDPPGGYAYFWSATESSIDFADYLLLPYNSARVVRIGYYKSNGNSVRCLRN